MQIILKSYIHKSLSTLPSLEKPAESPSCCERLIFQFEQLLAIQCSQLTKREVCEKKVWKARRTSSETVLLDHKLLSPSIMHYSWLPNFLLLQHATLALTLPPRALYVVLINLHALSEIRKLARPEVRSVLDGISLSPKEKCEQEFFHFPPSGG